MASQAKVSVDGAPPGARAPCFSARAPPSKDVVDIDVGLLVETHEAAGGTASFYRRTAGDPVLLSTFALPDAVIRQGHRAAGIAPVSGLDLSDSVHDAKLRGSLALFSWYGQGVVAADISDPRRPRFLARFLSRPEPDPERLLCPGRRCTAVWGIDVEGETIVASDLISGLWVLRLRRT